MLSKEAKVCVKNKENKTACFIEMEGLLNSPALISDLPGLGIEEQQRAGGETWRRWMREHSHSGQEVPGLSRWLWGLGKWAGLQRGTRWLILCPTDKSRSGAPGTVVPQLLPLQSPTSGIFQSATTCTSPGSSLPCAFPPARAGRSQMAFCGWPETTSTKPFPLSQGRGGGGSSRTQL